MRVLRNDKCRQVHGSGLHIIVNYTRGGVAKSLILKGFSWASGPPLQGGGEGPRRSPFRKLAI